jgi:hypothetical protein
VSKKVTLDKDQKYTIGYSFKNKMGISANNFVILELIKDGSIMYTRKLQASEATTFDYTAPATGEYTWRMRSSSIGTTTTQPLTYSLDNLSIFYTYPYTVENCDNLADGYRFGFNTQEKDDEVYGAGNLNTAEFWEYDTRLGRRWNVDPKPNFSISPYAAFANNPIWKNDVKGDTPTVKEAAMMSKLVYGDKLSKENQAEFSKSGWKISNSVKGVDYNKKSGFKSALFERTIDGKTEYTLAFAGTEEAINDGSADLNQIFGMAKQYEEAIKNSRDVITAIGGKELTFTGHSLGGGLANASALATGKASFGFNPAWVSTATMARYGLLFKPQTGISNYVILGEIVNSLQRRSNPNLFPQTNLLQNVGKTNYLFSFLPLVPIYGPIKSHSIDNVINEIEDVNEYNTIKDGY